MSDQLAIDNMDLVRPAARRLSRTHQNTEELIGWGYIALVEAAQSWDPERGIPFRPYAQVLIKGAMIDAIRVATMPLGYRTAAERKAPSGNRDFCLDAGLQPGFIEKGYECVESLDLMRWALAQLNPDERDLVFQCLILGRPQAEIGAKLGLTNSRISQRLKAIRQKLRRLNDLP